MARRPERVREAIRRLVSSLIHDEFGSTRTQPGYREVSRPGLLKTPSFPAVDVFNIEPRRTVVPKCEHGAYRGRSSCIFYEYVGTAVCSIDVYCDKR